VDIIVIGALFLVLGFALNHFGFWQAIDMDTPHGLIVQGCMFLVLWFVLSKFLFVPFVQLSQERVAQTDGRKEDALAQQKQAEEMFSQYKAQLQESKIKAATMVQTLALEAEKEEKEILDQARAQAKDHLQAQIQSLEEQQAQAKQTLEKQIPAIVDDIVAQTLGFSTAQNSSSAQPEMSQTS
jgi:F-type H+-transporting ATPase subunit b